MKELARIERGNVTIIITKNAPKEIVSMINSAITKERRR